MIGLLLLAFCIFVFNTTYWLVLNQINKNNAEYTNKIKRFSKLRKIVLLIPPLSLFFMVYRILSVIVKRFKELLKD
jgi:TRAP-type C4-dicarboxylate transport system permease small subunit